MKPEQQIQKSILEYLAVKRIWCRRMNTGAVVATHNGKSRMVRYGSPGMADILCTLETPGDEYLTLRIVWLEVKDVKGKQSQLQVEFQKEVEYFGHNYFVVSSIEDVENALNSL